MNTDFDTASDIPIALHATGIDDAVQNYDAYMMGKGGSGWTNIKAWAKSWHQHMGSLQFPMTPEQIRDFIQARTATGKPGRRIAPQSMDHLLGYISDLHIIVLGLNDPTAHILVTSEMKALYRARGSRAKPIAPLRLKGDVADIAADDPLPGSITHMIRALEDNHSGWVLRARVVLGLGADTGRDRSDYVRLNVGDVVAMPDGIGHALFGANRTADDIGEAPRFVSPETMIFIREWLEWREKAAPESTEADAPMLVRIDQKDKPGGRLSIWGYVDVLKEIMRRVGGAAHVSGNSFQAGLKLDLAAIGTTKVGIANALGFKELS